MAIKQLLELIGDDIVIAKLDKVQKKGEETLASFSKSMPDLKVNIPDAKPIEDFGGQTIKLKDALHALRPILQASGIQFSEFGGLARLASTSLLGLAAATTGAVILGFAKLEENAAKAKGELADLFGGQAQGQKAFAALESEASKFGTTVDNLVPGIESLKKALDAVADTKGFVALDVKDLPTQAGSLDKVTAAYGNFIKILRAGRLTQDEAQKSAKSFFDTFKDGGPVTVAALQALPVGSLQLLQQALGRGGQTAKTFFDEVKNGTIGIEQVNAALANFGPQAQTAFDTKAIHTFSDEIGKILSTLSKGFAEATGKPFSDFVIGELKRIREGIESTLVDLKRLKEIDQATELPGIGKAVQTIRDFLSGKFISTQGFDEAGFAEVGNLAAKAFGKGFVDASSSIQNLGAAGSTAGSKIAQGMDQASASIQKLRDTAKETGKEMDQIVIGSTRFKGRLDQIPVFEPQLAGEASDAAAKAAQKSFLDNPFFKEGTTIPIKPEINKDAFEQNLETLKTIIEGKPIEIKPVVPTEAQQLLVQQFAETGQQAGTNFAQGIDVSAVFSKFQELYQSVVSLFAQPIPVTFESAGGFGGQLSGAPFASGGMVRGKGTTSSDSILAWLSNHEFVVNARAVSHYGPDLFAALNTMRLPRDFIGRFNMGGLARAISGNRFAAGGQVRSSNPVVLKIDRQSFNMMAGDDTIAQLKRFAVTSQMASTGRKPRWVK